ncbi:MAG: DMT family transporter [Leptospira sp.]|nr:DMT family transporter [Leptospira sp.]NCS94314.1 DMT family transporter [Leptospira sp.]
MQAKPPTKFYLLLTIAMVTWGFAWPSGKAIAGMEPAPVIIFWRFLLTAITLLPVILIKGKSIRLTQFSEYRDVLLGAILYTVYNQFFLYGLENGLAGAGGVLVTTLNPIITYILVLSLARRLPTIQVALGLTLGLIGGCILLRVWEISLEALFATGNIYFLLAAFFWAMLSMNSHSSGSKVSPEVYGFYVYSIGTLIDFAFAIPYGIFHVFEQDILFWSQVSYLAIVSTTFGTTVYFFAASRLGSRRASSFIFLVPVTALFGSWIFLNEIPSISTVLGGVFAILAVTILNSKREEF